MPHSVSNRDAQVQILHPQILNYQTKLFTNQKRKTIYLEILVHISLGRSPLDSKILVDSVLLY